MNIPGGVPILGQQTQPEDLVAILIAMPAPDGQNLIQGGVRVPRVLVTAPALIPDDVRNQMLMDVQQALWQSVAQMFGIYQQNGVSHAASRPAAERA